MEASSITARKRTAPNQGQMGWHKYDSSAAVVVVIKEKVLDFEEEITEVKRLRRSLEEKDEEIEKVKEENNKLKNR